MNLSDLNLVENDLMEKVRGADGFMEDKVRQLARAGVFSGYREVYRQYVKLIEDREQGLEALKRAIFLQWYSVTEPSCFTGIPGGGGPLDYEDYLDRNLEKSTLTLLENKILGNEIDNELRWMLAYYYKEAFYYFDIFDGLEKLKQFLEENKKNILRDELPKREEFMNRGQLGIYFIDALYSDICCEAN